MASGLFMYIDSVVFHLRSVADDGTLTTAYGKGRDAVATDDVCDPHTTLAYTMAEIGRATRAAVALGAIAAMPATMDSVARSGIAAYLSTNGKGRGTVAELLRRRSPDKAEAIIDAMTVRYIESLDIAA